MRITYRRWKLRAGGSLRSLRLLESAAAAALVLGLPAHGLPPAARNGRWSASGDRRAGRDATKAPTGRNRGPASKGAKR